jgi:hypothetical protein
MCPIGWEGSWYGETRNIYRIFMWNPVKMAVQIAKMEMRGKCAYCSEA